jgi:hypothetical protein
VGISFNIEMLFLVDEMFKQKDHVLTLTFGKPIPWQTFGSQRSDWEWARKVKTHVYRLELDPEAQFIW